MFRAILFPSLLLAVTCFAFATAAPGSNKAVKRLAALSKKVKLSGKESLKGTVRAGLTGDSCKKAEDCEGDRVCRPANKLQAETCEDADDCCCHLKDVKNCKKNSDCDDGELCVTNNSNSDDPFCYSSDAVKKNDDLRAISDPSNPRASPDADNVCIAVHSLRHLERHELVYENDRMASVMCDASGSCATPGHIVLYRGQTMMMASYCAAVKCDKRVMKVNSPRYTRALRIPSKSEGLEFTAFAARYETPTEEKVLAAAVRVGL